MVIIKIFDSSAVNFLSTHSLYHKSAGTITTKASCRKDL